MNINFQKARELMVENQLRPNKINDPIILDLFKEIRKEDFLPEELKDISYIDSDSQLHQHRGYLKNLHLAQLINSAGISHNHKIFHIGGMTGYVSVILANLCKKLVVIENETDLITIMEKNIQKLNIKNINIVKSSFQLGYDKDSPYDVIFIDNPIEEISSSIKNQLNSNSGKIIMIVKTSNKLCKAFKLTKNNDNYTSEFLFDVFTEYELYKNIKGFIF